MACWTRNISSGRDCGKTIGNLCPPDLLGVGLDPLNLRKLKGTPCFRTTPNAREIGGFGDSL